MLLVAGKEHSSIFRVTGWETVKRRDFGGLNQPHDAANWLRKSGARGALMPSGSETPSARSKAPIEEGKNPISADIANFAPISRGAV